MKRSGPPRRTTPLARGGSLKRGKPVKARNAARRKKEWARAYGSPERVAFVKSLPCCASGVRGGIENAHVGVGGMSRKADYTQIVPLHADLHRQLHQIGRATFERVWHVDLSAIAASVERAWQSHQQARRAPGGATVVNANESRVRSHRADGTRPWRSDMMRLSELNPRLVGTVRNGVLVFDCPVPGHTHKHRIHVHDAGACTLGDTKFWQARGEFPHTLTLWPSIDATIADSTCWHGFIENGAIK